METQEFCECNFCAQWKELEGIQSRALEIMNRDGTSEVESLLIIVAEIKQKNELEIAKLEEEMWADSHLDHSCSSSLIKEALDWYRKQRTTRGISGLPRSEDFLDRRVKRSRVLERVSKMRSINIDRQTRIDLF